MLYLNVASLYIFFILLLICLLPEPTYQKLESLCKDIFKNGQTSFSVETSRNWSLSRNIYYTDNQIRSELQNSCNDFLSIRKYVIDFPANNEEMNLKISFSIATFKSANQVERLLRAIYRPWNYYCIHVDLKSSPEFFNAIEQLVRCLNSKYNNIINTDKRVDVQWGEMSVLTADLNCMNELYERYKDWKYLINLTGQEFPLKTNAELVKILKAFKGANNLEGTYTRRNEDRVPTVKMPFPIIWFKGSIQIAVNRDFVRFIFKSPISLFLLTTLKDRKSVPEQQFFATLNYNANLRIRGSYVGDPDMDGPIMAGSDYFITRYKNKKHVDCEKERVNGSHCTLGMNDLPKLTKAPQLFANKFDEESEPVSLYCLLEWYIDKLDRERLTKQVAVEEKLYESLPFVKYRYIPPKEL